MILVHGEDLVGVGGDGRHDETDQGGTSQCHSEEQDESRSYKIGATVEMKLARIAISSFS